MLDENLEKRIFTLDITTKADRLDKVLAQLLPEYSRSRIQNWIEEGHVRINSKSANESKVRTVVGPLDVIEVDIQPDEHTRAFQPEDINFDVIDESTDWIVIGKPAGLVTHPGSGNWSGTLLNGLLYRFPELKHVPRAGIVHRLDKDTSGVLVVARNEMSQFNFIKQLQARTMGRKYIAIVSGTTSDQGVIADEIGRDPRNPIKMASSKIVKPISPKEAITHYETIRHGYIEDKNISLINCRLETGRTHQIRVHMASINHPLVGDELYGGIKLKTFKNLRQMLHAYELQFNDPVSGERLCFRCDVAEDMKMVAGAGFEPTTFGL